MPSTYLTKDLKLIKKTFPENNEEEVTQLQDVVDTVLDSSSDAIILIKPDGIITRWNKAAERIYGYKEKEVIGKHIRLIYPKNKLSEFNKFINKLKMGKPIERHQTKRIRKDGSHIDVELTISPIRNKKKEIIGATKIALDITKLKQTEDILSQYSHAVEQSPSSIIITNNVGKIEYVNPKFTRLTGYSLEEVKGKNPRILKSGYTKPEEYAILWKTITSGKEWRGEFHNKKKNGELYWEQASISPIKNIEGKITHFLAVKEDITKRKELETELDEERRRWQGVVEGIADEVWICDNQGKMSLLNLPTVTAMGLEEFKNKSVEEVLDKVDILYTDGRMRPKEQAPLLRSLKGEIVRGEEIMRSRKTGKTRYRHFSSAPMRDIKGNIIGAVAIVRDITKNKQTEKALIESEERYRTLFQSAADAIVTADKKGKIIAWNNAAKTIFGYSEREIIGQPLTKLMPELYRKPHHKGIHRLYEGGNFHVMKKIIEVQGLRKDGTEFPIELSLAMWGIKEDKYYIGIIRDITERRELEKRKDDFVALASHELKTPITSIKMYTQVLEKQFINKGNMTTAKFFSNMDQQLNRLTELIYTLLDVSRVREGKIEYKKEKFPIDDLIKEIIMEFHGTFKTHKIMLDGQTRQKIIADKNRIRQVIINLINNAIKYSPKADKVIINTKKETKNIVVKVQDFGIGIPKAQQDRIFDRFYQVDNLKAKTYPGLGLGLYIAKEVIENHQGKLWLKSQEHKGSSFYFSLPIKGKD